MSFERPNKVNLPSLSKFPISPVTKKPSSLNSFFVFLTVCVELRAGVAIGFALQLAELLAVGAEVAEVAEVGAEV